MSAEPDSELEYLSFNPLFPSIFWTHLSLIMLQKATAFPTSCVNHQFHHNMRHCWCVWESEHLLLRSQNVLKWNWFLSLQLMSNILCLFYTIISININSQKQPTGMLFDIFFLKAFRIQKALNKQCKQHSSWVKKI